ncbi:hypothetical protein MNU23_30865 [Pseudomonas aeruginosa]|uniref:hypothetical protein n=1 Tax=Pseudomonas aeruginosa TaxID=287 RepID=UPI0021A308AE|nr:hypothetical protein [Pseudomonas aeruginosa]MCT2416081.1 hypothetical protein [Pseudomonas aeruginosa]HCF2593179.1 hypothetical protein [Pseudomonas aeruginosa]
MSQAANQDFLEFLKFAEELSLKSVLDDRAKVAELRKAHAQFLALLTTAGELLSEGGLVRQGFSDSYAQPGVNYLSEVVSDCSEFIMCVLLGLYRSAGGTLRSSIESYLKAFSANEQPLILQRTSVPDVFDDAAEVSFFSSRTGKTVIAELKGVYTSLNAYVHTISENHMFGTLAVGSFPRWSDKSVELIGIFIRAVRLFLYGIIGSRRDLYDRFDYRNKVIANRAMTRVQRRSALGVDD